MILTGKIEEVSKLLNQAGLICICSVDNGPKEKTDNSAIFDCEKDSTDDILKYIGDKAQLR